MPNPGPFLMWWFGFGMTQTILFNVISAGWGTYEKTEDIFFGSIISLFVGPLVFPFYVGGLVELIRRRRDDKATRINEINRKLVDKIYRRYSDDAKAIEVKPLAMDQEWLDHWNLVGEVKTARQLQPLSKPTR